MLKYEFGLNEIAGGFKTKSIIFFDLIKENEILCDVGLTLNMNIDEVIVKAKNRIIEPNNIYGYYQINRGKEMKRIG